MGRTPLSGWRLLHRLRDAGLKTSTFGYSVALQDFDTIVSRLRQQLASLAATDDYIVIGHSLGGVLLRAAIHSLPSGTALPRHVYLLGSPIQASRIAARLGRNRLFRMLTGDCGQLLGALDRMNAIAPPAVPVTGIVGTRGIGNWLGIFGDEVNDGLVSISEVSAPWLTNCVRVPVLHTWLPSRAQVAEIILQDMRRHRLIA